ncbi:DNA-directed RNA polymerase subunit alpha C-terminal domain-containing protein [Myxococcus fulvus]|uniref:DNA-directed RNA polymerase subunit alpha C-terminal domain-containing protein n=1 Tax=Myxococcus fulvus TaxID=33 RepID=UPI0020BD89AB|nr:DNA-directed RNA polymerase subunit alpha C-terminal domain-containing protein [Myxococcus fulvus]MCK8497231.1 hypothetical protein [Myxococcus fulvus]
MADLSLQLQADNLPLESLEKLFVEGHWSHILNRLLTGENLLIEGCRGVGKTMLMRAATERLTSQAHTGGKTLGIHTTFKRYLATIPPPGGSETPALSNFKAWVNSRILGAAKEQFLRTFPSTPEKLPASIGGVDWDQVVSLLETTYRTSNGPSNEAFIAAGLSETAIRGLQGYTYTVKALQDARSAFNLDLLILLLDDAAHALDTRAQGEFFTIIKSLYSAGLAFKISVYPAVTRYGLDFSYGHDAVVASLGEIPTPATMPAFVDLLRRRIEVTDGGGDSKDLISLLVEKHEDWIRLLVYCSNGNPRGLLKLLSQLLTELRGRTPASTRYEDVRNAINFVMDRHLDNMIPGIIKDLDPRLMRASELLLDIFREKLKRDPGPLQANQPRMFLAITNSLQVPYLCSAAVKLLVAANVLSPAGPARLSQRENGTLSLLHPGFVFRDNVLAGTGGTVTVEKWLNHFDTMSSRFHAEISKSASLWSEVLNEANAEPSYRCVNGHPMLDALKTCEQCGAQAAPRGPAEVLLDKDIDVLDLSDRIKTRLRENGFNTVRKVFEATPQQIDAIPFIGDKRLREVRSAVEAAVDEYFAG